MRYICGLMSAVLVLTTAWGQTSEPTLVASTGSVLSSTAVPAADAGKRVEWLQLRSTQWNEAYVAARMWDAQDNPVEILYRAIDGRLEHLMRGGTVSIPGEETGSHSLSVSHAALGKGGRAGWIVDDARQPQLVWTDGKQVHVVPVLPADSPGKVTHIGQPTCVDENTWAWVAEVEERVANGASTAYCSVWAATSGKVTEVARAGSVLPGSASPIELSLGTRLNSNVAGWVAFGNALWKVSDGAITVRDWPRATREATRVTEQVLLNDGTLVIGQTKQDQAGARWHIATIAPTGEYRVRVEDFDSDEKDNNAPQYTLSFLAGTTMPRLFWAGRDGSLGFALTENFVAADGNGFDWKRQRWGVFTGEDKRVKPLLRAGDPTPGLAAEEALTAITGVAFEADGKVWLWGTVGAPSPNPQSSNVAHALWTYSDNRLRPVLRAGYKVAIGGELAALTQIRSVAITESAGRAGAFVLSDLDNGTQALLFVTAPR